MDNRSKRKRSKDLPEDVIDMAPGGRRWLESTLYGKTALEIGEKAKRYFKEYPTNGYSTFASPPVQLKKNVWFLKIRRFSTCD